MTTTRSASSWTSVRTWLESSTVPPATARARRRSRSQRTPSGSRPFAAPPSASTGGPPTGPEGGRAAGEALGVGGLRGLVERQHRGVAEQRGGEVEALAHAEREAADAAPAHALEPDELEHLVDARRLDPQRRGDDVQVVAR